MEKSQKYKEFINALEECYKIYENYKISPDEMNKENNREQLKSISTKLFKNLPKECPFNYDISRAHLAFYIMTMDLMNTRKAKYYFNTWICASVEAMYDLLYVIIWLCSIEAVRPESVFGENLELLTHCLDVVSQSNPRPITTVSGWTQMNGVSDFYKSQKTPRDYKNLLNVIPIKKEYPPIIYKSNLEDFRELCDKYKADGGDEEILESMEQYLNTSLLNSHLDDRHQQPTYYPTVYYPKYYYPTVYYPKFYYPAVHYPTVYYPIN